MGKRQAGKRDLEEYACYIANLVTVLSITRRESYLCPLPFLTYFVLVSYFDSRLLGHDLFTWSWYESCACHEVGTHRLHSVEPGSCLTLSSMLTNTFKPSNPATVIKKNSP
jgi:hypothetical protein